MTPDKTPNLRGRTLRGFVLLGAQRTISFLVTAVGWLVLARFLAPDIFGVYAIIAFAVGLGVAFGDLGFGAALIQRRELDPKVSLSAAFIAQFALASVLGVSLVGLAPLIVEWLGQPPTAANLLRCLAVLIPLSALRMPAVVLLERQVNYRPLTIADTLDTLVFNAVAVSAAWLGAEVWSFIVGAVAARVVGLVAILGAVRWRPELPIRWEALKPLFNFGLKYQATSLLVMAREAVVPIYVAAVSGVVAVGFLHWALALASLPLQVVSLAGRVLFPALSQIQDNPVRFAEATERALNRVAMVLYPAALLLFAGADPIVRFLYGATWLPAVPAIRLFCIAVLLGGTWTILVFALNSLGRIDITFRLNVFWTLFLWGFSVLLVPWLGFIGYAVARVCMNVIGVWTLVILKRFVPITLFPHVRIPLLAGTASALMLWGLSRVWVQDLFSLIVAGTAAAAMYLVLINWTSGGGWKADLLDDWKRATEFRA